MSSNSRVSSFEQTLLTTLKTIKSNNLPHAIHITTNDKVSVFGDIHGDIETLKKAYSLALSKGSKYFIFCGDYIDKGKDSLACFQFVLNHFNTDPTHFIPLTGNHETLFHSDLYSELLETNSTLIPICWEVICLLPIAITLTSHGRNIYCAHGGFPRLYRPKLLRIHDEYEDVWKLIKPDQPTPSNTSDLIYESNTTFNLSPTDYINTVYDDYARNALIFHESPYHIHDYSKVIDKLDAIRSATDAQQRQTIIDSLKEPDFKKYVDRFIAKLNDYKSQVAKLERSKQNVILLKDYIQESDAYTTDTTTDGIDSYESFLAFVKKCGTQFFKHERYEVQRFNLVYPINELKQWMSDSKINAVIRGHELTLNCAAVIDFNKNNEETSPQSVEFNSSSSLYLVLHTTSSYAYLADTYAHGKFAIIDDKHIDIITVSV